MNHALEMLLSYYLGWGTGIVFWILIIERTPAGNWWKPPAMLFFWPIVLFSIWRSIPKKKE